LRFMCTYPSSKAADGRARTRGCRDSEGASASFDPVVLRLLFLLHVQASFVPLLAPLKIPSHSPRPRHDAPIQSDGDQREQIHDEWEEAGRSR
jgi:hypothetical protein